MIYIKSAEDIDGLQKCGAILAGMFSHLEPYIQPGITPKELDTMAESYIRGKKAIPVQIGYMGFPAALCVSVNDEVIHGIPRNRVLKAGDLVSIDCTIGKDGLITDSARTYPVGEIKKADRNLLERTEQALYRGIGVCRHGMRINEIGRAIEDYIKPFNYGIVRDYCGHGVGYENHEDPSILHYYSPDYSKRLKENTVFTIEPMINKGTHEVRVLDDQWTVVTVDGSNSAHFEHTIALTKDGCRILTVPG